MQEALARPTGRVNKLVAGGIAVLGASAIAITPVSSSPALLEAQHRAVQLVADVTDSTADVYQDLFSNTATNIGALVNQFEANPFPILSAIAANQQGYANQVGTAFESAETAFNTWWESGSRESAPGKTLLADAQTALESGDLDTFYNNFNKLVLFGIQNTVLPILNGTVFNATGIPVQMAQNFTDALTAALSSSTLVYGGFQALFAPVSGGFYELSRDVQAVSEAATAGDVQGALTALINTPGTVTNAVLNGFDYDGADGTTAPWAGLLSTKATCTATRCAGDGTIAEFLSTIPAKIAAAITNTTTTTTTGVTATTLALPAASDAADAADAAVDAAAGESGATATEASTSEATTATLARSLSAAETATSTESATDSSTGISKVSERLKKITDKLKPSKVKSASVSESSTSASGTDSSASSSAAATGSTKSSDSSTGSAKSETKHAKKAAKKSEKKNSDS